MKRIFLVVLAFYLGTITASLAAAGTSDEPFTGEWKLNPSKSKLTDQMKVENVGGNKYAFDFGGGAETIIVDGTDQPGGYGGTTLSVTAEGPNSWKVVRKKDGRVMLTAIWKLSRDGKTLTDDFTSMSPDGSTSNLVTVYKRRAGGSGFAATWVSTSETMNSELLLRIQPWEGDGLSFITPSQGTTTNLKFDDKSHPQEQANGTPAAQASMHRVDGRTLEITNRQDGKILQTKQFRLSSHNNILTLTVHVAGRDFPSVLVFERQ